MIRSDPTLVRVRCRLDPGYAASAAVHGSGAILEDVRRRVEAIYRCECLSTMQDPTDGSVIALVRGVKNAHPSAPDPYVSPVSAELVDAPHVLSPAKGDEHLRWDPGLRPVEAWAIERALAVEDEPNHLRGFATACEPFFPVAASRLRERADDVDRQRPGYAERSWPRCTREGATGSARAELRDALHAFARSEQIDPHVLEDEARRVACILVENPAERRAILAHFPAPVRELGESLVKRDRQGRIVADAKAIKQTLPPTGREDQIDTRALMLVAASSKPQASLVASAPRARDLLLRIEQGAPTSPELMTLHGALEGAQRAIERRRWAEWYVRTAAEEVAT